MMGLWRPGGIGAAALGGVAVFWAVAWGLWPVRAWLGPGPWLRAGLAPLRSLTPRAPMAATVVVAGLAVAPVPTVMALAATLALIRARRRSARQRARERDAAALPVALELCAVTLGAGGTVFDCLRILAERGPDPVGEAAAECVQEAGAGARLDAALSRFRDRLGLAFQPLTGALLLAWRQGGSVGLLLARLTSEANASRRRLGELRARRLPVLLLLPLVVFTLPAVLIGTVVPVVVVALRDLDL